MKLKATATAYDSIEVSTKTTLKGLTVSTGEVEVKRVEFEVSFSSSDITFVSNTSWEEVQEAIGEQNTKIAEQDTKISANNALIKALEGSMLPTGDDYAFVFMEEDDIEGLTKDNTSTGILYFGLEEEEEPAVEHATYAEGYVSMAALYSQGYASVSGATYDGGFASV